MRYHDLLENADLVVLYHITSKAKFKLDPNFAPEDNSFSLEDRSGNKGIYLTKDVEKWVNGHGYIRPFVAEIYADPSALEYDSIGRWGGEIFIPASQFDKLRVNRVIPLDAICREVYGGHGWLESCHGIAFDTGEEIDHKNYNPYPKGYRYEHDVRAMTPEQIKTLTQRAAAGKKAREKYR